MPNAFATQPDKSAPAQHEQGGPSGRSGRADKRPIKHYRRFHGYDYNRGASLFVTFAVKGRRPVFGRVEGDKVALSAAGQSAAQTIEAENRRPGAAVRAVSSVVMPDHVHLRLVLASTSEAEPLRLVGQFVGNVKRWARVHAARLGCDIEWEEGYHDRICVSRFINGKVDAYIGCNPLKYTLMHGPDAPLKVHEPLSSPRFPDEEWWTAAGNLALLAPERKIAAVSISRSLGAGVHAGVVARLLKAARSGWVIASTFISPGEQAAWSALEAEGLPCIKALPDPLKMVYRPKVEETAAFAAGRLLVVSRECAPEISRYDAWHGMGEALARAAAAYGGGAGAYIHRKGGLAKPRWEQMPAVPAGICKCGLKGHTYQVEQHQGGHSGCLEQHEHGGPSDRPEQHEQGGPSGRPDGAKKCR